MEKPCGKLLGKLTAAAPLLAFPADRRPQPGPWLRRGQGGLWGTGQAGRPWGHLCGTGKSPPCTKQE